MQHFAFSNLCHLVEEVEVAVPKGKASCKAPEDEAWHSAVVEVGDADLRPCC
jgi:hypothetical protein